MTDWTDKALDFMTLYDEEKSLWQTGKMANGRYVIVRHDPLVNESAPGSLPHTLSMEFLRRIEFPTEADARNHIRAHAAEVALKEIFAHSVEVSLK